METHTLLPPWCGGVVAQLNRCERRATEWRTMPIQININAQKSHAHDGKEADSVAETAANLGLVQSGKSFYALTWGQTAP